MVPPSTGSLTRLSAGITIAQSHRQLNLEQQECSAGICLTKEVKQEGGKSEELAQPQGTGSGHS